VAQPLAGSTSLTSELGHSHGDQSNVQHALAKRIVLCGWAFCLHCHSQPLAGSLVQGGNATVVIAGSVMMAQRKTLQCCMHGTDKGA
jgi:hypothetical protein